MDKFDFIQVDKRILEQRLRRHELSQQEYQKILKGLSNDEGEAEELPIYREEDSEKIG